jgi:hypothetical protein
MEQSKQQPQVKRDVIKHSAAIQIQNNVTLLQRRAWNVLLANAYDELPIQDIHQISVQRLMMSLEFNPTATLECIAKICPCKKAVLQGPVTRGMRV